MVDGSAALPPKAGQCEQQPKEKFMTHFTKRIMIAAACAFVGIAGISPAQAI